MGQIRTISVVVLLATAAALGMAGAASATTLDYSFNSDNQGWLQNQDQASNNFAPAGFQSSGGNPGGHLSARDTGSESGCPGTDPCQLLTFYSPIVPVLGSNYGGAASFDLRASVNPAFAAEFVLLPPPPNYLVALIPEDPVKTYNHLSIALTESRAWAVCPYAGGACAPPTQGEFKEMIATSDQLAIMVDVGANGTGETYDLDNVALTEGAPPPPPPPLPRHKKCKKKHAKKSTVAKKKKCKKKKKKRRAVPSALRG